MKRIHIKSIEMLFIFVFLSYFIMPEIVLAGHGKDPGFQKGMCYVTWSKEGFRSKRSDESLEAMSGIGVNCVQVVVTWYQETFDSCTIEPLIERTPSEGSIKHVIKKAHSQGMSVMLKPHIDLIRDEGNCRGDIGFSIEKDWEKWFRSYSRFIEHYAKIAERMKVEYFCVGTELSYAATKVKMWEDLIIPKVRKVYSGEVIYAANWDNYQNIKFWNSLDYAGIDAYFPLSTNDDPSLSELKTAWRKWVCEIETWQAKIKKPVIFTESGYCSADSAARRPWEEAFSGVPNMEIQANCYKALLETFCNKSWFCGMYWWKWNTYAGSGGMSHRRFTPQNKPALTYVELWYRKDTADVVEF